MDGWDTIKNVRLELSEATRLAKDKEYSTAFACMQHAITLLMNYCNKERGPEHGFEGRNRKRKF